MTETKETVLAIKDMHDGVLQIAAVLQALAAAACDVADIDGHQHVFVPPGYKLEDITALVEQAQPVPFRKRGTVALKDVDSLLAYCADQGDEGTGYIYADPDKRSMTAVFNDHRDHDTAGWRDHRATFAAEYTPEFSKWLANNGKHMSQGEFADFIEDNLADIQEAELLLNVATTIQAKTDVNFSSSKRLENGQVQLTYTEVIDASARGAEGALQIPRTFTLGLRIFKNGDGYRLNARLKYRLAAGGVKFWFELDRPVRAVEDAFDGYVKEVAEKGGYVVLLGAA